MKSKNTIQKDTVRILVFEEKSTWYATALELNIVESGDTPQEAILLLFEAVQGYLESAKKMGANALFLIRHLTRSMRPAGVSISP